MFGTAFVRCGSASRKSQETRRNKQLPRPPRSARHGHGHGHDHGHGTEGRAAARAAAVFTVRGRDASGQDLETSSFLSEHSTESGSEGRARVNTRLPRTLDGPEWIQHRGQLPMLRRALSAEASSSGGHKQRERRKRNYLKTMACPAIPPFASDAVQLVSCRRDDEPLERKDRAGAAFSNRPNYRPSRGEGGRRAGGQAGGQRRAKSHN
ncbi:hypothetical protein SRHO_G00154990 [Serrasalmus rhombeus]